MSENQMTGEQFASLLKEHVQVMVMGLMARYPVVPPQVLIPAIASALGMVMSEATATPNIQLNVTMRKMVNDAFSETLRKHVSCMPMSQNVAGHG